MSQVAYPNEIDLLSVLGVDPERSDDIYSYIVTDAADITLRFSFNPTDDTIQTWLGRGSTPIAIISHEKLTRMWIDEGVLRAECQYGTGCVQLALSVYPIIRVEWSGLRTS